MSRTMQLALVGLSLLAALGPMAGCASAEAASPEVDANDQGLLDGARASDERPQDAQPTTPAPIGAPSDPWTERPAAPEGRGRGESWTRLVLPDPLAPIAPERRPALPASVRLGVVCARERRILTDAGDVVMGLEGELSTERARLAAVIALYELEAGEVGLERLARAAQAQGLDLLLVDVRPAQGGGPGDRDGLLLHAATGSLLGCYEVRDGRLPRASAGRQDDLVDRVGEAYARVR